MAENKGDADQGRELHAEEIDNNGINISESALSQSINLDYSNNINYSSCNPIGPRISHSFNQSGRVIKCNSDGSTSISSDSAINVKSFHGGFSIGQNLQSGSMDLSLQIGLSVPLGFDVNLAFQVLPIEMQALSVGSTMSGIGFNYDLLTMRDFENVNDFLEDVADWADWVSTPHGFSEFAGRPFY